MRITVIDYSDGCAEEFGEIEVQQLPKEGELIDLNFSTGMFAYRAKVLKVEGNIVKVVNTVAIL